METPFIGREALDSGRLTRHGLRTRFVVVYPGVYVKADSRITARERAHAAWLWSKRRATLAGRSAAALHGTKWLDGNAPAELIYHNRHRPKGIRTWADAIAEDEIEFVGGIRTTTPARTALDLARRQPLDPAVAAIDALLRATRTKVADVELLAARHQGDKGIRNARVVLDLVDPGAESARETWLWLLIIRAGFPRPETQVPVIDEFGQIVARVDIGWPELKIAVEYDGDHHWTDRRRLAHDIRRTELLMELGWIVIRITAEDSPETIRRRIGAAFVKRGQTQPTISTQGSHPRG
jgi:very-short-patch-repair endonuclease